MSVGPDLRAAREAHGLSLDELSARTKISVERLKAIEDEDLDRLPPLIYLKGFVRAYADEVGFDPDATTQQYLLDVEQRGPLSEFESEDQDDIKGRPELSAADVDHLEDDYETALRDADTAVTDRRNYANAPPADRRFASVAAMSAIVALTVWVAFLVVRNRDDAAPAPSAALDEPRSAAEAANSGTPVSPEQSAVVEPTDRPQGAASKPEPKPQSPTTRSGRAKSPSTMPRASVSTPQTTRRKPTAGDPIEPDTVVSRPSEPVPSATNLSGEWTFTNRVESSQVPAFKGMTLGFRMRLVQDGTVVTGDGVKVAENGRRLSARQQTPITLHGELEGDRLELTFTERGRRRSSSGAFMMELADNSSMSGRFVSDAAGSRGRSRAVRIAAR